MNDDARVHWLVRPRTIRGLWWGFGVALTLTVLAQLFIPLSAHFGLDEGFAFNAWYGFAACVAMVFGAKAIGLLLKRPDDYYECGDEAEDEA